MTTLDAVGFLDTVIAFMSENVVTTAHDMLLRFAPGRYRDLICNADSGVRQDIGQLFLHFILRADWFAQELESKLPGEFESIFWPEIRRRLISIGECTVANFGLFRLVLGEDSSRQRTLKEITFQADPQLSQGRAPVIASVADERTYEMIRRIHGLMYRTWEATSESEKLASDSKARLAIAAKLLQSLRSVLEEFEKSPQTREGYLRLQSRAISYCTYYSYVSAFRLSLTAMPTAEISSFGSFALQESQVAFTPHHDLLALVRSNLPPSRMTSIAI